MASWDLNGNAGTNPATDFIGTTDSIPLMFRVGNVHSGYLDENNQNVSFGTGSYDGNLSNTNCVAIGYYANAGGHDAHDIVAIGSNSLLSTADGNQNVGIGTNSLAGNVSGYANLALGYFAGAYLVDPNRTIVLNSIDRTNEVGDLTKSPLIIKEDDFPNNQLATFNAQVKINDGSQGNNKFFKCDTNGLGTWTNLPSPTLNCWGLAGNSGTMPGSNFIGTSDSAELLFKVNSIQSGFIQYSRANTSFGYQSMNSITTGVFNTAFGQGALKSNTVGGINVAIGNQALENSTTAGPNLAVGHQALAANITGTDNTAVGTIALRQNITGSQNTAIGEQALNNNNANNNTALGHNAMFFNSTGNNNLALGFKAGFYNTIGSNQIFINSLDRGNYTSDQTGSPIYIQQNATVSNQLTTINGNTNLNGSIVIPSLVSGVTATSKLWKLASGENFMIFRDDPTYIISNGVGTGGDYFIGRNAGNLTMTGGGNNIGIGDQSCSSITDAYGVIGIGLKALKNNTTGVANTGVGNGVLKENTTGFENTAFGFDALYNATTASYNTGMGAYALYSATTGEQNTAVGDHSMTSLTTGFRNTGVGVTSLSSVTTGSYNVALGSGSQAHVIGGNNNTALGYHTMHNNTTGSGNVAIGYLAGESSLNGLNDKLLINTAATGALIYGDFSTGQIQINSASTPVLTDCAQLEVISATKGLLFPRMTTTQKNTISSPTGGLVIYDTDLNKLCLYTTNWETITSI